MNFTKLRPSPAVFAPAIMALILCWTIGCNRTQASGDVMAKVNGRKILGSEVEKYFRNQTAGSPQPPAGEQAKSLRLSILKELIDNEILMQRAEKLGLLATDEEVESKLNEIKAPYTPEDFNKRLLERKITLDDFKRDLRRSITVEKVLNKELTSKINVTDADVQAYYNAHRSEFNLIEPQYHLAQIFVSPQPNPQVRNLKNDKAQNDPDARKKIQEILNRLDSGEDFATVAMNYSEDPDSAGNGGDLGFTPQSGLQRTDAGTRDIVAKLKPGQYSGIIAVINPQTKQLFGYRIVKLIAKEPAGQRELSDPRVQQAVRDQLRERREQLLKAAYYDVIRDQAKVENYFAEQILKETGSK
ncbi:MAG TPA: SurA N-terminal domain-containing protein [Terriglobales bacterium]|nr:SurA N-terminal domain-containing protein [Terriglobales bacterium]